MELDDFKRKPRLKVDNSEEAGKSKDERIDFLIDLFRSHEKKQKKKLFTIVIINLFFASVYLAYMISRKGVEALGYSILGIGFFAAVLYLVIRYKSLSAENYTLSLKEFLELAERKTSYFTLIDYIIVVPLLMAIGTGGGLVFTSRLLRYTDNKPLLIILWGLFFVSLCLFGFWAGKKNWQKESGELNRRIKDMKNDYSSDKNNLSAI
jgi:hypothetical protein